MKKGINKGFSLVELIVVVLIMAIIAVVLAPQVTKWVQNSREAKDLQTLSSMTEYAQLAMTDADAYAEANSGKIDIEFDENDCTVKGSNVKAFATKLGEIAGVTPKTVTENKEYKLEGIGKKSDSTIKIEIKDGVVTPTSNIENEDLGVSATSEAHSGGGSDPAPSPSTSPDPSPSTSPEPVAQTISINTPNVFLSKNDGKLTLTASYTGCETKDIKWSSSNSSKVRCNQAEGASCEIQGIGGNANETVTITAQINGTDKKATCKVTLTSSSTMSLNYENYTLEKGESFVLEATGSGKVSFNVTAGGDKVSTQIVDNKCTVMGARKGEATIEVSMEGSSRKMTCKVTVNESVTYSISLSQEAAELEVGESTSFEATVSPATAKVSWGMSADDQSKGVIELNSTTGEIKAVKEGTVTVIAKIMEIAEQKTASIVITVTKAAPAQRTVIHYFREAGKDTEICKESVNKDADNKYTSTKSFDNLKKVAGAKTTFLASDADADLKVVWEVRPDWSVKFEKGGKIEHSNWNINYSYPATIKLNKAKFTVFETGKLADTILHCGEELAIDPGQSKTTVIAYERSASTGVVTLDEYEGSTPDNNNWHWTKKTSAKYTLYIKP